ncbi:MAG: zinc-binding dehydrogenase [Cyclobacteriaceae bacterium]
MVQGREVSKSHARPLIDSVFPLEDAVEAFEKMKVGGQLGKFENIKGVAGGWHGHSDYPFFVFLIGCPK